MLLDLLRYRAWWRCCDDACSTPRLRWSSLPVGLGGALTKNSLSWNLLGVFCSKTCAPRRAFAVNVNRPLMFFSCLCAANFLLLLLVGVAGPSAWRQVGGKGGREETRLGQRADRLRQGASGFAFALPWTLIKNLLLKHGDGVEMAVNWMLIHVGLD